MFRSRQGRWILRIVIVLALVGVARFAWEILIGLIVLNVVARALAPIARKRNWGSEGRITRLLSRPRFVVQSRRTN